jgi:hypothetical protein
MTHLEIERLFNEGRFGKDKINCKVVPLTYNRANVNTGFGNIETKKTTSWYLLCECESVKPGLPQVTISSKIFARNFILAPFRFLGLASQRVKTGIKNTDEKIDVYCKNKIEIKNIREELPFLFNVEFSTHFNNLINKNFKGDINYNTLSLSYKSIDLSQNENDIKSIEAALDFMIIIKDFIKKYKTDPLTSVKRGYSSLVSGKFDKGIQWTNNKGEFPYPNYPKEILSFINILSDKYWEDVNYTQKPVTDWLQNPNKIENLSLNELKSTFTYIVRQERFCEGFWQTALEKGYIRSLLKNK